MFQSIYDTMISGNRWLLILSGLKITLIIAVFAVLIGTVLGCIFALMKVSGNRILRAIAEVYTTVLRGIPLALLSLHLWAGTDWLLLLFRMVLTPAPIVQKFSVPEFKG